MPETVAVLLLLLSGILSMVGVIWLIRLAFARGLVPGLVCLVTIPVMGPLIFGVLNWRTCRRPLVLLAASLAFASVPFVVGGLERWIGFPERERVIDGKRYLNLTGWDRGDYTILSNRPDIAVLEMGNPDVDDTTLDLVVGLEKLEELTLNDSRVTDTGLAKLATCPSLVSLRIARTKITNEGLAEFLANPPEKLRNIDVTGLEVPTSVLRRWRNADPDNRRYVQ